MLGWGPSPGKRGRTGLSCTACVVLVLVAQPCPPRLSPSPLQPRPLLAAVTPHGNAVLTVHPGIRAQRADAGSGLGGVGDGLAGGPSVKVDVDGHGGAGEDQEPDDGQDVGNAHKLQGAAQGEGTKRVTAWPGMGTGEREGPQAGWARGR